MTEVVTEISTDCEHTPHDGSPVQNHSPAHTAGLTVRDPTLTPPSTVILFQVGEISPVVDTACGI